MRESVGSPVVSSVVLWLLLARFGWSVLRQIPLRTQARAKLSVRVQGLLLLVYLAPATTNLVWVSHLLILALAAAVALVARGDAVLPLSPYGRRRTTGKRRAQIEARSAR